MRFSDLSTAILGEMKRWGFYFEKQQESSIKSVFFLFVNAKTCLATEKEVMWRTPWEINWKCTILQKIPAESWKTASKSSPSLPISTWLHAFCRTNMAARQSFIVLNHLSMPIQMKDGFSWPPLSSPAPPSHSPPGPLPSDKPPRAALRLVTIETGGPKWQPTAPPPVWVLPRGGGHIGPANLNARLPQQIGQFT